jgi:NAD-dependent dihydropyrimidine dehydrogenase PreA subunit
MPYVVSDECILCGACEAGCPNGAIHEGETKSVIDLSLCVECGTCADNCPAGAISFVEEQPGDVPPAPLATSGETRSLATSGETGGLVKGDSAEKGPVGE